jgi:hypothetical protein
MAITPKKIFDIIKNNFSKPISPLDELIGSALPFLMDPPPSQIQEGELVEQYREGVKNEINKHIADCKLRNIPPYYEYGTSSNFILNKKSSIQEASQDFMKWLSTIDPSIFEFLCNKVLELEGCDNIYVTPLSSDGGVYFWGTKEILVIDNSNPVFFKEVELLIIKQAKRYSGPVGISDLRNFIGAFHLIKIVRFKYNSRMLT